MKPVVGIGSNTKYGRVLKILRDGVVVENSQGVKETVSFRKIEKSLKGNSYELCCTLVSWFVRVSNIRCKYPKHGRLNVLKWHEGVIDTARARARMVSMLWCSPTMDSFALYDATR